MYYRNRSYNTETGRFLQHDPLGYVDGMNLYIYCDSNPVMNTDPTGKHFAPPIISPWPIIKPIVETCALIRMAFIVPCTVGLATIATTCKAVFDGLNESHCVCDQLATNGGLRGTCFVGASPVSWFTSPLETYGDLWDCDRLGYDIISGETPDSIPVY